jgi:hypothetical protein
MDPPFKANENAEVLVKIIRRDAVLNINYQSGTVCNCVAPRLL